MQRREGGGGLAAGGGFAAWGWWVALLASVAHVAIGIWVLVSEADSYPRCASVWEFCVAAIVHSGLLVLALGYQERIRQQQQQYSICCCFTLALMLWGAGVLGNITAECKRAYTDETQGLWTYFLVSFSGIVTILALVCCCASATSELWAQAMAGQPPRPPVASAAPTNSVPALPPLTHTPPPPTRNQPTDTMKRQ